MKMNKFLIILAYYERPTIVLNALNSLLNITYPEFEVHFIDDGSINKGEPIVRDVCSSIIDKFTFHYINNTIEEKKEQKGSIHGQYLNLAIEKSNADHVIILCDDDAIYPDFLNKFNDFLNEEENKNKKYFYHKILLFDSLKEPYTESIKRNNLNLRYNEHNYPMCCRGAVDSSQVTYDRKSFVDDGLSYPSPQTEMLDYFIFQLMYDKWGNAYNTNLISQVKSYNETNLIERGLNGKTYLTSDSI